MTEMQLGQLGFSPKFRYPAVSQAIEDAIEYLGIALTNTINLISPGQRCRKIGSCPRPRTRPGCSELRSKYLFHIHFGLTGLTFLPYDPDRGVWAAASVMAKEFLGRTV